MGACHRLLGELIGKTSIKEKTEVMGGWRVGNTKRGEGRGRGVAAGMVGTHS